MSVPTETCEVSHPGNGVTTSFPTTFYYQFDTELRVSSTVAGVETVLTLGVHYTASSPNASGGGSGTGSVSITPAPGAAETIKIQRLVAYKQATSFRTQGSFSPAVHEDEFDEVVFQVQQTERRLKALESAGAPGSVVAGAGLSFSGATLNVGQVAGGGGVLVSADALKLDYLGEYAAIGPQAPVNVTAATAAVGTSEVPARADHKHNITTAAAGAVVPGASAAEGAASSLARSDHAHSVAVAAPVNVTKAAAAAGTASSFSRSDHKHDVDTAAAATLTDATNAEGTATSLARSDHTHSHGARGGGTLHAEASTSVAGFMSAADKLKVDVMSAAAAYGTVQTTDATVTTVVEWAPAAGSVETLEVTVVAKRFFSSPGYAGYRMGATFVSSGAGTVSQIGTTTVVWSHEDVAGFDATVSTDATKIRVRVNGAGSAVDWQASVRRYVVT